MVGVTGGAESTALISQCGTHLGAAGYGYNAMSADGETLFFTPIAKSDPSGNCGLPQPAVAELYARLGASQTVKLSGPSPSGCHSPCGTAPPANAMFTGASRDGSRAFFLSTGQLTDSAVQDPHRKDTPNGNRGCPQAQASGCNLYLYDFGLPAGERLIDVSAGSPAPHVQGVVRSSQDGSHVYFVATGVLAADRNENGEEAKAGADNLYVYERDARFPKGHTAFIGALSPGDETDLWHPEQDFRAAQVTPDGEYLVFQSRADLTADDTSSGVTQVFEYEAQTGVLRRVSVGDAGFNDNGNTGEYPATILTQGYSQTGTPAPRPLSVSNDGSYVFFESADALSQGMAIPPPGAGTQHVYAYHNGAVQPISPPGVSGAGFQGASASGTDVFFRTIDRLVAADTDTQSDLYDARIGGGFPLPAVAAVPCHEDSCQGTPSTPPNVPTPPHFEGPGNVKETTCKKGFVRKHGSCVKQHVRKHHKKHKRANTHRRASR